MFGDLEALRHRPIPPLGAQRERKTGYRDWPIDSGDPRHREACADMRDFGVAGINHYNRPDNPPYYSSVPGSVAGLFLRTGLIERLRAANAVLRRAGMELFVFDAWRPAVVQAYFHDVWFPQYLRTTFPDWPPERVAAEVATYWAKGACTQADIDPASPPPHATGGAVDLTLRRIGGDMLWMGTIFDDVSARAFPDALEHDESALSLSDEEARRNRRLLYWVMDAEGFVVNPTEWWHVSFGDQMWAKLASAGRDAPLAAFYSVVDPTQGGATLD